MALDLTSFKKAVESFEGVTQAASSKDKMAVLDKHQKNAIRAGVIQNFEFTYELSWKFMQRWLRENQGSSEIDYLRSRKDLFRAAAKYGLIQDPLPWFEYSDARNLTSHTYSEDKAEIVFQTALRFVSDAKLLLQTLERLGK